jgi:hypothetical protein
MSSALRVGEPLLQIILSVRVEYYLALGNLRILERSRIILLGLHLPLFIGYILDSSFIVCWGAKWGFIILTFSLWDSGLKLIKTYHLRTPSFLLVKFKVWLFLLILYSILWEIRFKNVFTIDIKLLQKFSIFVDVAFGSYEDLLFLFTKSNTIVWFLSLLRLIVTVLTQITI